MIQNFDFELKEISDEGSFTGRASVYGVVDHGKDVVETGAFAKNLREKGNERPLLFGHNSAEVIGVAKVTDSASALLVEGRLTMTVRRAQEALALMKSGALRGLSIGFQVVRQEFKDDIRLLKECILWEISTTPLPMNESAQILQVKQLLQKAKDEDGIRRALDGFRSDFERALRR